MKFAAVAAVLLTTLATALPSQQARAGVNVNIDIAPPGVFGRIDIGHLPLPKLVLPVPVIGLPVPVPPPARVVVGRPVPAPEPIYVWVPDHQRLNWKDHCARYGACGRPVYFVEDRWYHDHVLRSPRHEYRYRDGWREERHDRWHEERRAERQRDRYDDRYDDRWDRRWESRWDDRRDGWREDRRDRREDRREERRRGRDD